MKNNIWNNFKKWMIAGTIVGATALFPAKVLGQEVILNFSSEHGSPTPTNGVYIKNYGDPLEFIVNSPEVEGSGDKRYLADGWNVSGNSYDYNPEYPTQMNMTITNDAIVSVNWKTQYLFSASSSTNGTGSGQTLEESISPLEISVEYPHDPHASGYDSDYLIKNFSGNPIDVVVSFIEVLNIYGYGYTIDLPKTNTLESGENIITTHIDFVDSGAGGRLLGKIKINPINENLNGWYDAGSVVSKKVIPNEDSYFAGWNGTTNSKSNPISVIMNSPQNIEAIFKKRPEFNNVKFEPNLNLYLNDLDPGQKYTLKSATNIVDAPVNWLDETNFTADSSSTSVTVNAEYSPTKYFRLEFVP